MHHLLSSRGQWALLATSVLLIAATRYHHFFSQTIVADATWAAMFVTGLVISLRYALPILLITVASIDLGSASMTGSFDSSACLTPAYPFLLLAYSSLWMIGRISRSYIQLTFGGIAIGYLSLTIGVLIAFVISNASWYLWAPEANLYSVTEYSMIVSQYALSFWQGALVWFSIATLVAWMIIKQQRNNPAQHILISSS